MADRVILQVNVTEPEQATGYFSSVQQRPDQVRVQQHEPMDNLKQLNLISTILPRPTDIPNALISQLLVLLKPQLRIHKLPNPQKISVSVDSGPNGQKQSQEDDCVPEQPIKKGQQLRKRTQKDHDGRQKKGLQ